MQELGSHAKRQALTWEFRGEVQQCWQKLSRGDWPETAVLWLVLKSESESRSVVSDSLLPHGLYSLWNSPGQNTRVCSLSLLQGIFPIQWLNPGLPHCRCILYQLNHKGSSRILEWVASYPFFSRSFQPRNLTRVTSITGGFFTNWAIREAQFNGIR